MNSELNGDRGHNIEMMTNYKGILGQNPKQALSLPVKGDHPELDDTELLNIDEIKIYQSLIGGLQWVVETLM